MPDNQAVIQVLYQTSGVESLKVANAELDKSQQKATAVSTATKRVGSDTTTALSMSRREWIRTGTEASYYMTNAIGKTSEMGKAISQTTGMVTQLGESFMFGSGVGIGVAAVGLAFSYLVSQQQEATKYTKSVEDALTEQDAASTKLGKAIQDITGLSGAEADAWAAAAKKSDVVAEAIRNQARAHQELQNAQEAQTGFQAAEMQYTGLVTKNVNGAVDALRWQALGERSLQGETQKLIDAQKEQNRVNDIMKAALPAIAKLTEDNAAATAKLTAAHKAAAAGFSADMLAAERKASDDRLALQADTARSIEKIYAGLSLRLADAADDANDRRVQDERDWLRQAQGYADDRARIERDLADQIEGITRDSASQEMSAKTYAEVLRIRADRDARMKDATKKAGEQRDELKTKQAAALEDHNYKENLAERESIKTAQRARRDADIQADEARRTEGEREAAIDKRLAAERAAIQERVTAEAAAYAESTRAAQAAFSAQVKGLVDTRAEIQKMRDDWDRVRDAVDAVTRSLIYQGTVGAWNLANMQAASAFTSIGSQNRLEGHAQGGSGVFPGSGSSERPYVISAQPGERYEITPKDKSAASGVNFYNCIFRDVSDVYAALNQRDRGLA